MQEQFSADLHLWLFRHLLNGILRALSQRNQEVMQNNQEAELGLSQLCDVEFNLLHDIQIDRLSS